MKRALHLLAVVLSFSTTEALMALESSSIGLPQPQRDGTVSVESALATRRSVREFRREPLTLQQVAQLLWAAQGVTHPGGLRTAPSAGALYPLELYVAAGQVTGLAAGVYRYRPGGHELIRIAEGDVRRQLAAAALDQGWIADAPAIFVVTAVYERTTRKYGQRGQRYVHMEVGHAGQNLCLQAVALKLATTVVGAFDDDAVKKLLHLPDEEQPLSIIPAGQPK